MIYLSDVSTSAISKSSPLVPLNAAEEPAARSLSPPLFRAARPLRHRCARRKKLKWWSLFGRQLNIVLQANLTSYETNQY